MTSSGPTDSNELIMFLSGSLKDTLPSESPTRINTKTPKISNNANFRHTRQYYILCFLADYIIIRHYINNYMIYKDFDSFSLPQSLWVPHTEFSSRMQSSRVLYRAPLSYIEPLGPVQSPKIIYRAPESCTEPLSPSQSSKAPAG